jgi:hypothetical protein
VDDVVQAACPRIRVREGCCCRRRQSVGMRVRVHTRRQQIDDDGAALSIHAAPPPPPALHARTRKHGR